MGIAKIDYNWAVFCDAPHFLLKGENKLLLARLDLGSLNEPSLRGAAIDSCRIIMFFFIIVIIAGTCTGTRSAAISYAVSGAFRDSFPT